MDSEHFDRHPDHVTPVDKIETSCQDFYWGLWLGLVLGLTGSGLVAVMYAIVQHA